MPAKTQASICLLGPWRAKEIAEFVHQPAEIRARDRYLARLARDRAGRDESGVLPIAAHHRRAELNVRMLALELVKPGDGAPPWRQSARDGLQWHPVFAHRDTPPVEMIPGRGRQRSSAPIMPRRITAISSGCAG